MTETSRFKLISVSGSLRTGSYSNAVLSTLGDIFFGQADLRVYDLSLIPPFQEDCAKAALPKSVEEFLFSIAEADGVVLCAPEFNNSMPGVLKNALDWASGTASESVMAYKPVVMMTANCAALGGPRCLEHMRVVLNAMMARVVVAREVIITSVHEKVRDGRLVDATSLGVACDAIRALFHQITVSRQFDARPGFY
jgi:chromate reductase, NAD(P)H dehydrogenase (quinone)